MLFTWFIPYGWSSCQSMEILFINCIFKVIWQKQRICKVLNNTHKLFKPTSTLIDIKCPEICDVSLHLTGVIHWHRLVTVDWKWKWVGKYKHRLYCRHGQKFTIFRLFLEKTNTLKQWNIFISMDLTYHYDDHFISPFFAQTAKLIFFYDWLDSLILYVLRRVIGSNLYVSKGKLPYFVNRNSFQF